MIYIPENIEDCNEISEMIGDCINCHFYNDELLKTRLFPCWEHEKFVKVS